MAATYFTTYINILYKYMDGSHILHNFPTHLSVIYKVQHYKQYVIVSKKLSQCISYQHCVNYLCFISVSLDQLKQCTNNYPKIRSDSFRAFFTGVRKQLLKTRETMGMFLACNIAATFQCLVTIPTCQVFLVIIFLHSFDVL